MDPAIFRLNDRSFRFDQQAYSFNDDSLQLFAPQQSNEQHVVSPAQPRSRGSSYTGSPTSPSAHRPSMSQPSASTAGLQPGYFATRPVNRLQATFSPVSPPYHQSASDTMNAGYQYGWDGFSEVRMPEEDGMRMSRNDSENANYQMPTPRRSTVGSNHSFQHPKSFVERASTMYSSAPMEMSTQALPQYAQQTTSPFTRVPAQSPPHSPPVTAPRTKTQRRARRSHHEDTPIGLVFEDNKKFKCVKVECKDSTFGRMADLRRHHAQHHAKNRAEYFCSFPQCPRAHAPTGGRGRSFGTRRDKRDEHERNVHKKERSSRESSPSSVDES